MLVEKSVINKFATAFSFQLDCKNIVLSSPTLYGIFDLAHAAFVVQLFLFPASFLKFYGFDAVLRQTFKYIITHLQSVLGGNHAVFLGQNICINSEQIALSRDNIM